MFSAMRTSNSARKIMIEQIIVTGCKPAPANILRVNQDQRGQQTYLEHARTSRGGKNLLYIDHCANFESTSLSSIRIVFRCNDNVALSFDVFSSFFRYWSNSLRKSSGKVSTIFDISSFTCMSVVLAKIGIFILLSLLMFFANNIFLHRAADSENQAV